MGVDGLFYLPAEYPTVRRTSVLGVSLLRRFTRSLAKEAEVCLESNPLSSAV